MQIFGKPFKFIVVLMFHSTANTLLETGVLPLPKGVL